MRHTSPPSHYTSTSEEALTMDSPNDLMMSWDSEPPTNFTPPPRIAARFNRTTKKKSASSSRRNSISSLHSNRSNRSSHNVTNSTHVAQHLRRISIIESRRAKIADRNAHAEQVRMRAQQAKAAPRTSRPSGEERTLAAQQAREKHLAQVAASCAEEVKRAKKIAEETKEKKAAEQARATEEMEKRHAEAEKRRLLYQQQQSLRRARTQSLALAEEKKVSVTPWKPKTADSAARVIQSAWRNSRCRKAISGFLELNLDLEHIQTTSFEEMSDLLSQERVLSSTARVLKLCGLLDGETDDSGHNVAVRTFLAAYLILSHPKQVLAQSGEQEEDLIGKAKVLLMQFQRILSKPPLARIFISSSEYILSLAEAYGTFQTAFTAWKNSDSSVLIETMIAQFVELDAIWQSIKDDSPEHVAEDYKEGIRGNQALLLARLKRLAGNDKALKMASDAVRARRKQNKTRRRGGEVKPRTANISPELPIATSSAEGGSARAGAQDRRLQTRELNKALSPLPANRIVVHELAINKDYRIEVDDLSKERQETNRAVFNLMRADVEAGIGDGWIISMAEIIQEKLLHLLTPGNSMHTLISETLDPKTVENQLKMGSFSYTKFFAFMNSILPKLCAPVRDGEVKALATETNYDYIERLSKLMHIIDLLGLDYANYLLQITAPSLIQRAVQYEQQCFQDQLSSGGTHRLIRWWRLARAHASADLSRRSPDGPSSCHDLKSSRIYMTGLVDLFIALPPLQQPDVPENLELDRDRIEKTRADVLRIIVISSILLTAKNLLKRDVRSQWRAQSQRMWDIPSTTAYSDSSAYMSIIETSQNLPPATRTALSGTIERVLADAREKANITHPVMKVLLQKIRTHAASRLAAESNEERVRSASTASEVLSAGGMAEFVGRIGALVEEMGRVRQVDLSAHGRWIDEVAENVAAEAR